MIVNKRIETLRNKSLAAVPYISEERALLMTKFYETGIAQQESIPVQRALAFKYLLENKVIWIDDHELIVGERGPAPKATPTYPEICIHSSEDLEIFNTRTKVPFKVDDTVKSCYAEKIIPFWRGKTVREKIFAQMTPEWQAAYEAGIFTEFQEQRSPGHTVLGDKIYRKGFEQFKAEIEASAKALDFYHDPEALDKMEELNAMAIAADALIAYARRHADRLRELATEHEDPERQKEIQQMAEICERVPAQAPQTFWEALQYYWFVHLGVITELNPWDSFNPGSAGSAPVSVLPEGDLRPALLTRERAQELFRRSGSSSTIIPRHPKSG